MPNRTRIVLSLALLLAAALLALPAAPARSQGSSATPTPAPDSEPRILYSAGFDGRIAYFTMNADGSDKQPVAEAFFANPRWIASIGASISPDGHTLAFGGVDLGGDYRVGDLLTDTTIHLMDLSTHTVTRLVTQGFGNSHPVWSPDGTTIAYTAGGENRLLHAVDVTTGETHPMVDGRILRNLVGMPGYVYGFDWSPDGSQLAAGATLFDFSERGYDTVFVMNADGSGVYQAIPDNTSPLYPAWGPEGNVLYYNCLSSETLNEICRIDLTTSEITQVTHLSDTLGDLMIWHLDVSSDNQIVFMLQLSDVFLLPELESDIYRYNIKTGDLTNLTADIDNDVWAPRWVDSPPAAS